MINHLLKNDAPRGGRALLTSLMAAVVLLMFAMTASAYTLVFRDGRRIQIPDEFTLTRTTLTYEISPGFNQTLLVALLDIPATERANRQAPGSFFKPKEQEAVDNDQPAPRAARTLTNLDLAAIRERRIESEQAYEKRRLELGLPTVEESRRRQAVDEGALRERLREDSAANTREERYWRDRARELRMEMAMLDSQINYVRGRLGELNQSSLNDLNIITGVYPVWPPIYQPYGWPSYPSPPFGLPRIARPIPGLGLPYPNQYPYPYPNQYPYPNGSYGSYERASERADLTNRLDDLIMRRAGLSAQWRALEDEARDAKIPQVWLEP